QQRLAALHALPRGHLQCADLAAVAEADRTRTLRVASRAAPGFDAVVEGLLHRYGGGDRDRACRRSGFVVIRRRLAAAGQQAAQQDDEQHGQGGGTIHGVDACVETGELVARSVLPSSASSAI